MRWMLLFLLACGSPEPVTESAPPAVGDEEPTAESAPSEPAEERATETLFALLEAPDAVEYEPLADQLEVLAAAVEREGSQLAAQLGALAESVRRRDEAMDDPVEATEMAIELLWLLVAEREPPDPTLCTIGRVLGLHGLVTWRQALLAHLEVEGLSVEEAASPPDCAGLDEASEEGEECWFRTELADAYRVAFAPDGALARIEEGLRAGPEATAAAVDAHLEATGALHRLVTVRPRRTDIEDLGAMCRPTP